MRVCAHARARVRKTLSFEDRRLKIIIIIIIHRTVRFDEELALKSKINSKKQT